jgi:hypothetical protein
LVLGGGNQNSIVFMDALYKLYNQNQVVFVKYNPVNDYLDVIFEKVMKPLFDVSPHLTLYSLLLTRVVRLTP